MAQFSTIEWTDATWNPVVGCRKVSSGCAHCYAERMAKRLAAMASADMEAGRNAGKKAAYLQVINRFGRWNGDIFLDYGALEEPYRWHTPRVIFVNSMSDLFHEDVPVEFIAKVFDVMNRCPQHTFQILTKRPERVAEMSTNLPWNKHIWMGTSIENQAVVERVSYLQKTKAFVRFLSIEPLIGPIAKIPLKGIHWVIAGGESGPNARPMNPDWVREIRDRCVDANVAFFFKQWGGPIKSKTGRTLDGRTWDQMPPVAAAEGVHGRA